MQYLNEKQLRNLNIEQLDEIRREVGQSIGSADYNFKTNGTPFDYTHKRLLEKYLKMVKAVLQHKVNIRK